MTREQAQAIVEKHDVRIVGDAPRHIGGHHVESDTEWWEVELLTARTEYDIVLDQRRPHAAGEHMVWPLKVNAETKAPVYGPERVTARQGRETLDSHAGPHPLEAR